MAVCLGNCAMRLLKICEFYETITFRLLSNRIHYNLSTINRWIFALKILHQPSLTYTPINFANVNRYCLTYHIYHTPGFPAFPVFPTLIVLALTPPPYAAHLILKYLLFVFGIILPLFYCKNFYAV